MPHTAGLCRIKTAIYWSKVPHNHVSNIFSKLRVAGRVQAIVRARNAGFGWKAGEMARVIAAPSSKC
jgi:hypothetical protein